MAENSAVCTLSRYNTQETGLTFARVQDGYFYPENNLYVEMNPTISAVEQYYYTWDEEVSFAPSAPLVSEEDAKSAYINALAVTLGIVAWPEAIDYSDPVYSQYISWGYTYLESLILAYYYSGKEKVSGVDALTGEITAAYSEGEITYDDLEGTAQKDKILRLAHAGIGFPGGSFLPDAVLTMRDAAILLTSSAGMGFFENDDDLKSQAVMQGFFTSEEWNPEEEITAAGFARMIINASRYGYTAQLSGLWNGDDGYVQIAEALHMLPENDAAGALQADDAAAADAPAPDAPCTRAEAAEILYEFMNRNQI